MAITTLGGSSKKTEDLESFVKTFTQEMYEKYNLKIDKEDPIVIEIALLFKFCDKISTEFGLIVASQTQKNEEIAAAWKSKEDEFFKVFFKEMQTQTGKFKDLTYEVFLNNLKESYQEMTKKHLVNIDQLFNQNVKKIRFHQTLGFIFQIITVFGMVMALRFFGIT